MTNWKPIDTAPQDGTRVMLHYKGKIFVGEYRRGVMGEPDRYDVHWRAFCCGKLAYPDYWSDMPGGPNA